MIDRLEGGGSLGLKEVARICGVHVATAWRWVLKGVRRQRLPSIFVGGQRRVLRADLDGFLAALNQHSQGRVAAPPTDRQKQTNIEAVLEIEGL